MNQKNKGMVNNLIHPEAVLYSCVNTFLAYFCSIRDKWKKAITVTPLEIVSLFLTSNSTLVLITLIGFKSSVTGDNIGLQY